MGLKECKVHDAGVAALVAGLRGLPRLQFLDLNLAMNGIGRPGAESLSELAACPALAVLHLNVNENKIGDGGALGLLRLAGAPCMTWLRLSVSEDALTDACVRPGSVGQSDGTCPVPPSQRLIEFEHTEPRFGLDMCRDPHPQPIVVHR